MFGLQGNQSTPSTGFSFGAPNTTVGTAFGNTRSTPSVFATTFGSTTTSATSVFGASGTTKPISSFNFDLPTTVSTISSTQSPSLGQTAPGGAAFPLRFAYPASTVVSQTTPTTGLLHTPQPNASTPTTNAVFNLAPTTTTSILSSLFSKPTVTTTLSSPFSALSSIAQTSTTAALVAPPFSAIASQPCATTTTQNVFQQASSTQSSFPFGLSGPTAPTTSVFTSVPSTFGVLTTANTGFTVPSTVNAATVGSSKAPLSLSHPSVTTSVPSTSILSTTTASPQLSLPPAATTSTTSVSNLFPGTQPSSLGLGQSSVLVASTSAGIGTKTVLGTAAPSVTTPFTAASSTTTTTTVTKPVSLTYRQLEELVNKWNVELDEQERYFLDEAARVNHWDQILVGNAEKIAGLHEKVEACRTEQTRLEQELDFIEAQQRELEGLLEPLEHAAYELPPGQQHADMEREAIFQLATSTDLELGQLLTDLREMAEKTNEATSRLTTVRTGSEVASKGDATTPTGADVMGQVTRILNSHMHSLNWIHQNTQELMDRLKQINTA